jgi:hypothetical protein
MPSNEAKDWIIEISRDLVLRVSALLDVRPPLRLTWCCQDAAIDPALFGESQSFADGLLAFAYETRDLYVAQLFYLERKHRRSQIAAKLESIQIDEARALVSRCYSGLEKVKEVLVDRGFANDVHKYIQHREAPTGCNYSPSDFAFVYESKGMFEAEQLVPNADSHSCADGQPVVSGVTATVWYCMDKNYCRIG